MAINGDLFPQCAVFFLHGRDDRSGSPLNVIVGSMAAIIKRYLYAVCVLRRPDVS